MASVGKFSLHFDSKLAITKSFMRKRQEEVAVRYTGHSMEVRLGAWSVVLSNEKGLLYDMQFV
jgi:hypothetical protein